MTDEDPTVHVEAPLSSAQDDTEPIRRGRLRQRPAPYDEAHTPTGFAPVRFTAHCVDRAGFKRRVHEYDRDGVCYFCSHRRPWDPL